MSTYTHENTKEGYILNQLEIDNSRNENEIELVLTQVKEQYEKFRKEIVRSEDETIAKINLIKQENYRTYSKKKKELLDYIKATKEGSFNHDSFPSFEIKIADIEQDLGLVIQFSLYWRKDRLDLDKICEIHKSENRQSRKIPQIPPSIELKELKQMFYDSRPRLSVQTSENIHFTTEMHIKARSIVKNRKQNYSILPMYNIILQNLNAGKSVSDIRKGIFYLSKYPVCLMMDPLRKIFHTIQTQSKYHSDYIEAKLQNFEEIFKVMEFQYQLYSQNYQIHPTVLSNTNYIDKLASICCELLLAFEELFNFEENPEEFGSQPFSHFSKKLSQSNTSVFIPPIKVISSPLQERFEPFGTETTRQPALLVQSQKVESEKCFLNPLEKTKFLQSALHVPDSQQFDPSAFECIDNRELYSLSERINSPQYQQQGNSTDQFKLSAFPDHSKNFNSGNDKNTWY